MKLAGIVGLFCALAARPILGADAPDQVLTTAAQVRSLSAADADLQHPVKLHGVVTFYDKGLFSHFIQDDTAGIYFLELTNGPALQAGQIVDVTGVTGAGEFAPIINPSSITVVGPGSLPTAIPVSLEQLVSGREDSQLVEFKGLVRSVHLDPDTQNYLIDIVTGGERFTVYARQLPVAQPQDLVDSVIKVQGVCSTLFNHQRQLFGLRLLVPQPDGLVVETPAPHRPYDLPLEKVNSLLQFSPQGTFGDRVKVTGTVVYYEPGSALFIQDDTGGLHCQTLQRDALQPGDHVEVLGFMAKGEYTPILEDAIYRKVGAGTVVKPDEADVNKILTGVEDCRLVTLSAHILDRVQRGVNQFLLLQSSDFTFQAYLPQRNSDGFDALQNGSDVKVTGVCLIERGNDWQAGENWRASSFHLLLRSPDDVTVVQPPPGVNVPDGLWIATACGVIAAASLLWVVIIRIRHRKHLQELRNTNPAKI
jgi:hypothetical protein